jgi:hypothetical protein
MASSTELTAFVVALVALGISLLQFIQQYMATSVLRSKIGRAVIGVWADTKKKSGFDFSEYKIRATYLEPTLTWERVEECLQRQQGPIRNPLSVARQILFLNFRQCLENDCRGRKVRGTTGVGFASQGRPRDSAHSPVQFLVPGRSSTGAEI